VISHALARAGFGDSLVNAFVANHHDPHALSNALSQWRTCLRHYLSTNPDRLLSKRHPSLANQISDAFPSLRVLEDYVMPQTSERRGHVPTFEWAKQPSLKEIANRCEMHYEWGVKPLILKRFRNVIWGGALMQVLRASAMEGDERERRSAGVMQTPRKGRRAANVAVGTPSKLIARTLSRMELATPRAREVAYDDEKPLIVKIHSQRTHASTDGILEYRVEIAPEQFVQITEKGLLGLLGEDGIDVENFGKRRALMDDDLDFGGDEDEGGKAGKKAKGPVHPNDHLRIWVPACMLEVVEPRLVEEFEAIGEAKEQKKRDKERRAQEKAEGKVSPKKSRAKTTSPTKTKANKPAIDDDVFGPVDDWLPANVSQPSQRTSRPKAGPPKKFIDEDSSGDDVGPTPRPRSKAPLKTTAVSDPFPLLDSGERDDAVSETDYMSTGSITERRRGKVVELPRLELPPIPSTSFAKKKSAILTALESPTKPSPQVKKWPAARPKIIPSQSSQSSSSNATRKFLFTMQPDVYDLDDDEDEGLEPYAALIGDNSGSSRASSGSQLGQVGHRGAIPQKKRVAVSKTMSRAFAGEEPMEDFSDLFSPMASPQVPELPSSQLSQSASRNGATKRHKFVSDDDLNDHSPVQKSPKKSKAHVSPRKQTNSAVPTNTTRPSKSAEKSATQAGQTSTTSSRMPASLQEVLADAPPSRGSWKKSKPVTKTNGGAVTEIIDLTSSDEDVFVAKPLKPTSSKPCGTAIQRSVATAAARPKLLEIIDLD
jgi:Holliday junction resolvase YEN1